MRRTLLVLVASLTAACADRPLAAPSALNARLAALPAPASPVRAALVVGTSEGRDGERRDGTVRVAVRLDAAGTRVGAYQGAVRFDPRRVTLVDASAPDDGFRVVNRDGADRGVVRFAGFATDALRSPVVALLDVRAADAAALETLALEIESVGSDVARAVPARDVVVLRVLFR